jgi:hypothetical protein
MESRAESKGEKVAQGRARAPDAEHQEKQNGDAAKVMTQKANVMPAPFA